MLTKTKQAALVVCLFLFLFVVIGGGLHLNPGGALLAAATGTPLVIHVLNRRCAGRAIEHGPPLSSGSPGFVGRVAEVSANHPAAFETETAVRR